MASAFTDKAARRIVRAVKKVENAADPTAYRPDGRRAAPVVGNVWATITEEVSDGSWASPGSGKAQIEAFDGEPLGDPVDVVNRFGGGVVPVGTGVALEWIGGVWQVSIAPCPA